MTAPLTEAERREVQRALWSYPSDARHWEPRDWRDIHAAVSRLAEMGMAREVALRLANLGAAQGESYTCHDTAPWYLVGAMCASPIELWGRAILEAARAYMKA